MSVEHFRFPVKEMALAGLIAVGVIGLGTTALAVETAKVCVEAIGVGEKH